MKARLAVWCVLAWAVHAKVACVFLIACAWVTHPFHRGRRTDMFVGDVDRACALVGVVSR